MSDASIVPREGANMLSGGAGLIRCWEMWADDFDYAWQMSRLQGV
jgi:hypothetical protein